MKSLNHRGPGLFSAIKWSYAANITTAAVRIFLLMFLARALEPEDFGAYGVLLSVLGFSGLLLGLGLNQAVVQRPDLAPEHITLALTIAGFGGVIGAIVIAASASLLAQLFKTPEIAPVLAFGSPILVVNILNAIGYGIVRRFMDFRWFTIVGVITLMGVFTPVAIILALSGAGVWSLVIAMAAQSAASTVAVILRCRHLELKAPARIRDSVELLKYGAKTAVYNGLNAAEDLILNFAILKGFGLTELGIFNRANRLRVMAQEQLGMSAVGAIFAHFARVHAGGGDLSREFRGSLALANSIIMPLFFGAATASDVIVTVILGDKFVAGANLLTWLFLMVPLIVNQSIASNVVVVTGRLWPSIRTQVIFLVVFASAIVVMPKVDLQSMAILWVALVFFRFLLYNVIAMHSTGIGLHSFVGLHFLGVWVAAIVCSAIVVSKLLFAFIPPFFLLPLLIFIGALALGLAYLIAPAALYEPFLVRAAFRLTKTGPLALLRRLLILKFGPAAEV